MNITKEQMMAYTEVIEVLKHMSEEEYKKVPKEIVKYFEDNMDKLYSFKIEPNKKFEEQVLLEKTKIVLAILYRDYWATEEQRKKIKQKEKYDLEKLEMEKKEKYNVDSLFKPKKYPISNEENTKALIEYKKESWYSKFLNFMKKFFLGK